MNQVAISVKDVSKKYTIGKEKDGSLRGTLVSLFSGGNSSKDDFFALKNVSFDIQKGDVVGVIGKNGAGKSTLLKILSQITRPTEGKIEIDGRIASLLEVGTGFHPELTGRENVYLNGTILGMTRKEVASKFDEIVAFSGIEKFIDTPVKHYSSGMYVRLAFAVAAHLEPEILIIDEVLAVGDAEFQKKCLGKMKDVAGEGRTVIFVSHDLGAVSSLCNKGILLTGGQVTYLGNIDETISRYTSLFGGSSVSCKIYDENQIVSEEKGPVKLKRVFFHDSNKEHQYCTYIDQFAYITLEFEILEKIKDKLVPNFHFFSGNGEKIMVTVNPIEDTFFNEIGSFSTTLELPANFLNTGVFIVGFALSTFNQVEVYASDYSAISFEVIDNLDAITRNGYKGKIDGVIRPMMNWSNKKY
jgi:lipopolysaccharide transport system ATP-binding protein